MNKDKEQRARALLETPVGRKLYEKGFAKMKEKGIIPGAKQTEDQISSATIESFTRAAHELWLLAETQEEKDFCEMIMLSEEFRAGVNRAALRVVKAGLN